MESKILVETDEFILNNPHKAKSAMIEEYLFTEKVKEQTQTLSDLCESMHNQNKGAISE
jgi:hypothetical protein